jgi:hypothetical protein
MRMRMRMRMRKRMRMRMRWSTPLLIRHLWKLKKLKQLFS